MRNHALDTARVAAMTIVITGHAVIAYMVTPIGWAIQDPCRHIAADVYAWIARGMAMPLFFVLAGYFSRTYLDSHGARAFVVQRVRRIGVPLAIALVPCSLALNALWDWGREVGARQGVPPHIPTLEPSTLPVTLGHLWFLYYLLALSFVALVLPRVRRVPPIALGALSLVPLLVAGKLALDTPLGFGLDPAVLVYEGAFFAWGWAIDTRELERAARRAWIDLAGAAVLFGLLVAPLQSGTTPSYAIVASGLFSLLLVDGVLGLCVRYGNRPSRVIRRAADASYVAYIVHLPLIVLLQIVIAARSR